MDLNIFVLGLIIGFVLGMLFIWHILSYDIEFLNSRIDYWYKSAMEYLHLYFDSKEKEEPDPADWWRNS